MSAILLDQDIVHYEVLGRGRPVVFLHSWVGSWRYWIPAMQPVSTGFRAYALDLWGFGDSAKRTERYSMAQQVRLLEEFLEKLGIGRVALVGHGLGALVGLEFALRNSAVVDRLLAIGLPLEEARIHPRLRGGAPQELADWLLERTPLTEPARIDAPKADPRAVQMLLQSGNSAQLERLALPCLMVQGGIDPAITTPDLDATLASLPENVHLMLLEGAGHFPMLEDSSRFNRLLGDFLGLPSGESPRQLQLKEEWKRRVR